jgi:hypothetical protein
MDVEIMKIIYIIVSFVAVAFSSYLNWRANKPEAFDVHKFFSAYLRTAWGLVPLALAFAVGLGLTVEGFMAIIAAAFGIDNGVQKAAKLRNKKTSTIDCPAGTLGN